MPAYNLIPEDSPILSTRAEEYVWNGDIDLNDLVPQMFSIMINNNGVGLAAPQIGVSKRILVINYEDTLLACINPEIVNGSGEVSGTEGCLSFPGLWLKVKRYETVMVRYQDMTGNNREETFSGFMARIFQHELDHLDGICFVKKVGPVALSLAKRKRIRASS